MGAASILRWSGSKAKLVPALGALAPIQFERYVEPFVGSACLFLALKPKKSVLGDINPEVTDVYKAVQSDPSGVASALECIPKTKDGYYALRAQAPNSLSLVERAARLIFLMKACFNGVYRTNKKGEFNVPMGDRIYALPTFEQLQQVSELLNGTHLVTGDFAKTLAATRPGDWIYMDPPYRQSGRYRGEYGYGARFNDDSLERLVMEAKQYAIDGRFVAISYIEDDFLEKNLGDWKIHRVITRRTVSGKVSSRAKTAEIVLTSY